MLVMMKGWEGEGRVKEKMLLRAEEKQSLVSIWEETSREGRDGV